VPYSPLANVPQQRGTNRRLLALAAKASIERKNDWLVRKVLAGDFNQAYIGRTVSRNEIEIHIEEPHKIFFHAHVLEFFSRSFPQALLPTSISISNPIMKFGDNRRARDPFLKRSEESTAVLIRLHAGKVFQLGAQTFEPEAKHSMVRNELADRAGIDYQGTSTTNTI
jgi:hypothetical protein